MSLESQIFGLAATATYVAGENLGISNISGMLQQMAVAFGGQISDGTYVYNLFTGTSGLLTTSGFNPSSTAWNNLTAAASVYDNFNQAYVGVSALIYAFSTFSNLEPKYQVHYINTYSKNIHSPQQQPTIFTIPIVIGLLSGFSLSVLNSTIATSPDNSYNKIVNYNWYDSTPFFTGDTFDAQLIKDVENQYYYLTGELYYNGLPTGLSPCVQTPITIDTPTGTIQGTYKFNLPCYDASSYVGPLSGTRFARIFNDGPTTSGYFDKATTTEYVAFDEAVLSASDYQSNSVVLYGYNQDSSGNYALLYSGVCTDIPGVYNPNYEYGYGSTNYMSDDGLCVWPNNPPYYDESGNQLPYMSMHQGDSNLKWWFYRYCAIPAVPNGCAQCAVQTGLYAWTGWKLVDFELDPMLTSQFFLLNTNPQSKTNRILKRALNIDPNSPYVNAVDTGDGILTCMGYVGPPQLNGNSQMPGFAFYQTFENQHFPISGSHQGVLASIVMRPVISTSSYSSPYTPSNRNVSTGNLSKFNVFSGNYNHFSSLTNNLSVPITATYHSTGMGQYDDVFRECLAIGDGFGGAVSFYPSLECNAGFYYTGYVYMLSGVPITQNDLLNTYGANLIGSTYKTVKYITGYNNISGGSYLVVPQVAQIETGVNISGMKVTGQEIDYYYFDTNVGIGATNTGWNSFAPIPADVTANPQNYTGYYDSQTVENYLPRYSKGPFVTYNTTFLYPNAAAIVNTYNSQLTGFPTGFQYIVTVKEETVREAYIISGFNNYDIPIEVIRSSGYNLFNLNTAMENPFTANNVGYLYTYNFNTNPILYPLVGNFASNNSIGNLVDSNYVPNTNGCVQGNLNSQISDGNFGTFDCGVLITGNLIDRNIFTGTGGEYKTIYNSEPIIHGVYWGYQGYQRSGVAAYVPPVFDLSSGIISPTQDLINVMYRQINGASNYAFSNNGAIRYGILDQGKDPITYEYMGGRSGITANQEGGYNTDGIIGDNWYDCTMQNFGQLIGYCGLGQYAYHYPDRDNNIILLALNSTGVNFYTRGLNYSPYYLNWVYKPFTSPASMGNIGINITAHSLRNEYYFNFNLLDKFQIINVNSGGWYYPTGLNIGPFPADVELCITGKNSFTVSGDLYVNGEMMASSDQNNINGCLGTYASGSGFLLNPIEQFTLNSGIILGTNGRSPVLSTFILIPSGGYANFNFSGTGYIGVTGNSTVTIRPRTVFGAVGNGTNAGSPDTNLLSGDISMMNNFKHISNGSEAIFSIPNNGKFEQLIGQKFVFETAPREEVLFPIPGNDFYTILSGLNLISYDTFGNITYDTSHGGPTYRYWKQISPEVLFTGFRNVSRISFEITELVPLYGPIPYQTYQTLLPSGSCTLSGAFGYSGEAESAIITKGIVMSGEIYPSAMSGILEPIYVSDILWGNVPSGVTVLPSGYGIYPVLSAPSYVQFRQNYPIITGNDAYVPLTPTGTNYNRFLWPALSDFATLNPSLTYEQLPPDDGNTFYADNLLFSASQGQQIVSGVFNPVENVTYILLNEFTLLNSTATHSAFNTGTCILTTLPTRTYLDTGNLTGLLAPEGTSMTLAIALL